MSHSTFSLAGRAINRMGYGAMQLAGPHVFGPPKDHAGALAVLREALRLGVNHIDTRDFYGPHVTNRLIREALSPYPDDLMIVTKLCAARTVPGFRPRSLRITPAESRTICAISGSTRWTWSICASWAISMRRPKARSPARSRRRRSCSAKA